MKQRVVPVAFSDILFIQYFAKIRGRGLIYTARWSRKFTFRSSRKENGLKRARSIRDALNSLEGINCLQKFSIKVLRVMNEIAEDFSNVSTVNTVALNRRQGLHMMS
jgi:hypothetical protein